MTHICVNKLTIIGSDNGLSPGRRQAIIWTNAGILLIGPLGTNFREILIEILIFSFKKMRLKVSSAKRRPFCLGLNVLIHLCVLTAFNIFVTLLIVCNVYHTSHLLTEAGWFIYALVNWVIINSGNALSPVPAGVTKPISSVPLISRFFTIIKTLVTHWISCSYLTGVASAQLGWHLSNMNVMQII